MEMMQNQRGRDMSAPITHITLNGTRYQLAFTNMAARVAEDVYEQQYGQDMGYADILAALTKFKYKAVMAMLYGALIAGGTSMSWDEFDAAFKLDSIDGIRDIILKGVTDSLPKADDAKDGAENP